MKLPNSHFYKRHFTYQLAFFAIALVSWLCAVSPTASAQTRRTSPGQPEPPRPTANVNSADLKSLNVLADTELDYVISAGDVISIQIEDAPELSRMYRVNAAGTIKLAWIGSVTVQNKTTEDLAAELADTLKRQQFLLDPNVVVNVTQYNSQTYFLQGAVNKPGFYQVEGRPTLLKLIGLAGGLMDGHGTTAFIVRRKKAAVPASANSGGLLITQAESAAATQTLMASTDSAGAMTNASAGEEEPDYELIKLNLSALYKGHFEENQRLLPGDIVNIPRSDIFYVAGEVNAPGSFVLKEGTTLRQAISLAQGTTFKAKLGRGIIFREDQNDGHRVELAVDIGAVMSGKAEDIPILANDVIILPNSRVKSIGSTLLTAFGANSARIPMRY